MNKTDLLDRFARDGESRLLLARILDQQQRAQQRSIPTHTGFLSPAQQAESADLLMAAAPGQGLLHGGYPDAERKLWAFLPDWLEEEVWLAGEDCPLCALSVTLPRGASLTHRDYLGALMGLGLTREKIGDILLTGQGAQVVVLRETAPILLSQWTQAGKYPVKLAPLPLDQLTPTPGERKQIRATVASPPAGRGGVRRVLHPPEPGGRPDPGRSGGGEPPPLRQGRQGGGGRGCAHLPGPGQVCPHGTGGHLQAGPADSGPGAVSITRKGQETMTEERIARLNELARKSKTIGLTEAEKQEQATLRLEYLAAIRQSLEAQLDNVYIVEADGTQTKLKKKDSPKPPKS